MPLGLSARSHVAHLDEFVYSGQVTLPEELDQLRLYCHSATLPLGLNARSPVAHPDEPFTTIQMDGLLPAIRIDELFSQLRWTSSYNSHRRALPSRQTDELLPINRIDELFPRHRGRAPTIHIDELFPSTQMDELPLYTLTSPSLQLRWTGSSLLLVLMSSSPQLRWTNSHNSY